MKPPGRGERNGVCQYINVYKSLIRVTGGIVARMASGQRSCLSLPRLCRRNVPLRPPQLGPQAQNCCPRQYAKAKRLETESTETREPQIPPQTVYDHLLHSQKLLPASLPFLHCFLSFHSATGTDSETFVQHTELRDFLRQNSFKRVQKLKQHYYSHDKLNSLSSDRSNLCNNHSSQSLRQLSITFSDCCDAPDESILA